MVELILNLFGKSQSQINHIEENNCLTNLLNVSLSNIEALLFGKEDVNTKYKKKFSNITVEHNDISDYDNSPLIKSVYKILSDEETHLGDNFSKYFIIKTTNQSKDRTHFKLQSSDLCWLYLITDQEFLIKFLSKEKSYIDYKFINQFCVPLWVKDEAKLREIVEIVAKNEYRNEIKKQDSFGNKMFSEQVSLYYLLAHKLPLLLDIMEKEKTIPAAVSILKFLRRDFSIEKNRKAARDNAMDLMIQKRYIYSAFFYLIAEEVDVIV